MAVGRVLKKCCLHRSERTIGIGKMFFQKLAEILFIAGIGFPQRKIGINFIQVDRQSAQFKPRNSKNREPIKMTTIWRINDPNRKRSDSEKGRIGRRLKPAKYRALWSDSDGGSKDFGSPSANRKNNLTRLIPVMSRFDDVSRLICLPANRFLAAVNFSPVGACTVHMRRDRSFR